MSSGSMTPFAPGAHVVFNSFALQLRARVGTAGSRWRSKRASAWAQAHTRQQRVSAGTALRMTISAGSARRAASGPRRLFFAAW
jgi:hypothetical protein